MKHHFFLVSLFCFVVAQNGLAGVTDSIACGDAMIRFQTKCGQPQTGIRWVHVHENETTAVQTAYAIIDSLNLGCFVSWQCEADRYVTYKLQGKTFKFDPNRIYTSKGLEASLRTNGEWSKPGFRAAKKVADTFISHYINGNKLIIAMHNNTDSGGLQIKAYQQGGEYANDAAEVNISPTEDIDDFFYTTDKRIYDYLAAKGFNILLQNNATVTDDGSLSVYCGYQGITYLNIEAQHGHLEQQKRMMLAVYQMISELFP